MYRYDLAPSVARSAAFCLFGGMHACAGKRGAVNQAELHDAVVATGHGAGSGVCHAGGQVTPKDCIGLGINSSEEPYALVPNPHPESFMIGDNP